MFTYGEKTFQYGISYREEGFNTEASVIQLSIKQMDIY